MRIELRVEGSAHQVHIEPGAGEGKVRVTVDSEPFELDLSEGDGGTLVALDGTEHRIERSGRVLFVDGERVDVAVAHLAQAQAGALSTGGGEITPPMPGRIVEVLVAEGDQVEAGQTLLVLEAMKMQNEIQAPGAARVKELRVAEGQTVEASDVLLVLEPL